jgi:hypothetical protein
MLVITRPAKLLPMCNMFAAKVILSRESADDVSETKALTNQESGTSCNTRTTQRSWAGVIRIKYRLLVFWV